MLQQQQQPQGEQEGTFITICVGPHHQMHYLGWRSGETTANKRGGEHMNEPAQNDCCQDDQPTTLASTLEQLGTIQVDNHTKGHNCNEYCLAAFCVTDTETVAVELSEWTDLNDCDGFAFEKNCGIGSYLLAPAEMYVPAFIADHFPNMKPLAIVFYPESSFGVTVGMGYDENNEGWLWNEAYHSLGWVGPIGPELVQRWKDALSNVLQPHKFSVENSMLCNDLCSPNTTPALLQHALGSTAIS
eukprot:TRINITY_DN114312_c0_g1_i1.p1 TRINITY_DN114312_c0_g1~~TRINITY_DN114312_c0_g1_i1.p1  ORF type:complete len:244 (+),score=35.60 TRINITY_DN114312_c0_g1_i1:66-797(+)